MQANQGPISAAGYSRGRNREQFAETRHGAGSDPTKDFK